MGFNCPKATEPLRGESLLLIRKFPAVTGTHLIHLRRIKGQYILSCFYKPLSQFSLKALYVTLTEENLWWLDYQKMHFWLEKTEFFADALRQNSPSVLYYYLPNPSAHTNLALPPAEREGGRKYVNLQILVKFSPTRAYFRWRLFRIFCIFNLQNL